MPLEGDEGVHGHAEVLDLPRAAEVGQVDHETGGDDIRAEFFQKLDSAFGGAAGGDQVRRPGSPFSPGVTASWCISISSSPYSRE